MTASTLPPCSIPNSLIGGRYLLLSELGRGGMSVVYRVRDCQAGRDVALKLLKISEEEPRNLLLLQQEFRAMTRLRHPRLVQVLDYGVLDSGAAFLTMELLDGQDLTYRLPLALGDVVRVVLSIADVLAFMHARGYVHRDVKPANVRILPPRPGAPIEIRLMDCGLTEQFGRIDSTVAGTLAYLAPEAWLGQPTGVRGDLYSLGVLAYEIAAGQLPFDTTSGVRLLKAKTTQPQDLRDLRPEIPVEFARLVCDLLAPEPNNRPASAMEVVTRLRAFADMDYHVDPTVYLRSPALVGRSSELSELRVAITDACSSKPVPIIIVGPAGSGKTRLLEEALLEAGLREAVVARASGKGFAGRPYEVLQELLTPLLHLPAAAALLSRIGGRSALDPLKRGATPDECERNPDPCASRMALYLAFATFLDGLSKHRRIVLAIDDIHLADAASVDALSGLLAAEVYGNIAIIATQRAGEAISQSLAQLLMSGRLMELEPMTQAQIGELIVGALGPALPSPTLLSDLERVSSGNVYFVLEILRDLLARGLIERQRTRVVLPDSLNMVGMPRSLSEALARRLALLSPKALQLARIVAVLGRAVELEFGRTLLGATDGEFLDAVDSLRSEELVAIQEQKLVMPHPKLREVLYQGMKSGERRQLHQQIAEHLLRFGDPNDQCCSAELGYHFAEAGDEHQALGHLVRAADARYEGFAYNDACDAYERAFVLLHAAPWRQRRALERKLSDRLGRIYFYHDHRKGPVYLERARLHHLSDGLLWAIAPLSRLFGSAIAVGIGVGVTTLIHLLRLRKRPLRETLERLMDAFAATTYLSNCYNYAGRPQAAVEKAEQLLPLVYSRHRMPRVGYLMARVYGLYLMNRFDESAAGCEEALGVLKRDKSTPISEHDRVHATGGAIVTRLWIDLVRGYAQRSRWWQPFEQYVRDHPTALLESWLLEAQVYIAYRRGNLAQTEEAWRRFTGKAAQAEVMFVQSRTKVWVGMAYLVAGRTSEAQDVADEVIRTASYPENPFILALGLRLRAMALSAWDQTDDAERCLKQAADLTGQSDNACWELHHSILLAQAELAVTRKRYGLARELCRAVEQRNLKLTLSHELHLTQCNQILGRVELAEGDLQAAISRLERSLILASELDDPIERGRSLHFLGQALGASGAELEAERCRQDCIQLFLELGNNYQLRRLGYGGDEKPIGLSGLSALKRVVQLVSEEELTSTRRGRNAMVTGTLTVPASNAPDCSVEEVSTEQPLLTTDVNGESFTMPSWRGAKSNP